MNFTLDTCKFSKNCDFVSDVLYLVVQGFKETTANRQHIYIVSLAQENMG
jgi:hypothetical protein